MELSPFEQRILAQAKAAKEGLGDFLKTEGSLTEIVSVSRSVVESCINASVQLDLLIKGLEARV